MRRGVVAALIAAIISACTISAWAQSITVPFRTIAGSISAANAAVTMYNLTGQSSCVSSLSGTWIGTIGFQGSNDGTHWAAITSYPDPGSGSNTAQSATSDGVFTTPVPSYTQFRTIFTGYTGGTANVTISCGAGGGGVGGGGGGGGGGGSVTQGTVPWVVNTPSPCATPATGANACDVYIDPSQAPIGFFGCDSTTTTNCWTVGSLGQLYVGAARNTAGQGTFIPIGDTDMGQETFSGTATKLLVALASGKTIYATSYVIQWLGCASTCTLIFEEGSQQTSPCDSAPGTPGTGSPKQLGLTYTVTSTTTFPRTENSPGSGASPVLQTDTKGVQFCAVTTGTGISVNVDGQFARY